MRRVWPYIFVFLASLVVFIVDLWAEYSPNASKLYEDWIAPFTDEMQISIFTLLLILATIGMLWKLYSDKKNEEINDLEAKMQNHVEMLILAHEKLGPYQLKEILLEFFKSYVTSHPYVLGVQLYDYSQQHLHGKTVLKLNYIDGFTQEQIDANAVQQSYYIFNISLFREFRDAYELSFQQLQSIMEEDSDLNGAEEAFDPEPLIKFVQKYNHRLSTKPIQALNEEDAIEFSFAELGMFLISIGVGETIEWYLDSNKVDKLKTLKKRTGFLQAIMGQIPFTFQHNDSNQKADRQYISSPILVNDKQFVYMILLDPEIRNESNWIDQADSLTIDFETKLVNCFPIRYSKGKKTKGEGENENFET